MTNIYTNAIVELSNAKEYNNANKKKIQKLVLLANDARVADALSENNVDAARFNARALYATEKCVKIVYEATRDMLSVADLNENAFAAIKCALLCKAADAHLLKSDIEASLLSDVKVSAERADFIYQRKAKISATAQVQQCIDMLKTLNIVKEVARNTFEVLDSALLDTFEEKFAQVAI
ncbi:hypothetical protein PXK56_18185 [Phaeobacter gallaeciensis]|uniref:hypothetical protein n=1 Tax=Phaeobacter gallaeciensis TaxID=60890 RepID=UPI0023802506|nr:hypothetical protein [Phaeobacter gallaeciensis]MDE4297116.1 hypothetical protein [Phaeobacter gallaeciensis]